MAYPPLNYKASEVSPGETALYPYLANPVTSGSMMPLLFGAQAARQGAAFSAGEAYKQDLALAMAQQQETQQHNVADELGSRINSPTPEALPLTLQLNPSRYGFTGAGGAARPDVVNTIGSAYTGLKRAQTASTQQKLLSGYKDAVEAGIVPPAGVQADQLGYTPTQQLPLSTMNTLIREQSENARHSADATKAATGTYTFKPGQGGAQDEVSVSGFVPQMLPQIVTTTRQMKDYINQPVPVDASGKPVLNMPGTTMAVPYATVDKNKNVVSVGMTGGGAFPAGGVSPPSAGGATPATAAAGAALSPARTPERPAPQGNSSAPAGNMVAPAIQLGGGSTQAAPQPTPQPTPGARLINGIPTMAPDDIQVTPLKLTSPEATKALQAMAAKFYEKIAGSGAYPPEVKDRVRQFVGAGAIGIGVDAQGRKWFTMNGQPVAAAAR